MSNTKNNTGKKSPGKENTQRINKWILALLVSVAANGMLAGFLISKGAHPHMQHADGTSIQRPLQAMPADPRRLVRALPPARRKQVMRAAMRTLKLQKSEHPRQIFKQLRQARVDMRHLLRADEIDVTAVEKSLAEIRVLNQRLAVSGDALMLEVLGQLTPTERKTALAVMRNKRQKNREKHKPRP